MNKFDELAIVLPCHSLEDLPTYYTGTNADGLLACWSALWQPAVLAACDRLPTWQRADSPPEPDSRRVFTVPAVSDAYLPTGWLARARDQGAAIVAQQGATRRQIADRVLQAMGAEPAVEQDLAADVEAVGYAYLQQELLSRRMRYSSALDEGHFASEVKAAAGAVLAADRELARKHLTAAVEVLTEARDRFFPTEAWLIDLTLVAETTLDERLRAELQSTVPLNLLLTANTLDCLARHDAALAAAIRVKWEQQTLAVVGGHVDEDRLPLVPVEDTLDDLRRGRCAFERLLGKAPQVYARRRDGLAAFLPQILARLEYHGALHFTLDDGRFPPEEQSKTRWEGLDGSALDALTRVPVDAADPGTFLAFSEKLGRAMDLDYVATLVFAHWPGRSSSWYDDLRRVSAYGPVFGRFVTLEDYFASSQSPGRLARFPADRYRPAYLKQDAQQGRADPLSSIAARHEADAARVGASALDTIAVLCGAAMETPGEPGTPQRAAERLAGRWARRVSPDANPDQVRWLVLNPLSGARVAPVEDPAGDRLPVVVELPGNGFRVIDPQVSRPAPVGRSQRDRVGIVHEFELANEHLSVLVDPETGALRSIRVPNKRSSLLSQQLAFRRTGPPPRPGEPWVDPDDRAIYSRMRAQTVETTINTLDVGEIVSRGELICGEEVVAGFEQRVRVWRGGKTLTLDLTIEPRQLPEGDPWDEYFAARFAWADEMAEIWRGVGMSAQPCENRRLEAPHYVAIHEAAHRAAILTGGLPYHRRVGDRMLDTLLIVPGETRRRFRLGIAVAADYPEAAALDLLAPPLVVPIERTEALPESGWFFHLDGRNVQATHWEPLLVEGRPAGFVARLIETEGRPVRCRLRAFRAVASARQVNFAGTTLAELKVEDGVIQLDFTAGEWMEVVAQFVSSSPA
ncbi:MAG: hypothetical protein K1X74_15910 [Pirellulales bacterium]|nr:hypothetical protein [Pirellulales bacterium]